MLLNPRFSLRQAGPADWPAVQALLQAHQLPTEGARQHLATYLLAVQGGQVVGCAGAEVYGDQALMRSVAVAPGLHGQGIGQALVQRLLLEAARRQIRAVHLLTVTAPEYFARYGFKRGPLAQAPAALKASAEFQGACPACAAFMSLTLHGSPARPQADLPVAVIGAGPVGLAATARLLERGLQPLLLEAGAQVGSHLLDVAHVRLFSPWRYNVDTAMAAQLSSSAAGWLAPPPDELPLAGELVSRVLHPYAALPAVQQALHLGTHVVAISREGLDKMKSHGRAQAPFVIRAVKKGQPVVFRARAVIDASGTWSQPNPLGADGLPALGERELAHAVAYGIPDVLGRDRARYAGRHTLVVGAGHSAANALLALAELAQAEPGTRLSWAVRSPALARVFGGGAADALPARGQLGQALKALRDEGRLQFIGGLHIRALHASGAAQPGRPQPLSVHGHNARGEAMQVDDVDQVICATGQRPDLGLLAELRLRLDPALESTEALGPLIDPNVHSCGTVRPHGHRELAHPEPGFYTLGVKSYGRAPTFLLATGYEQARSVAAALAGDLAAADRVELQLPETGVCSVGGPAVEVEVEVEVEANAEAIPGCATACAAPGATAAEAKTAPPALASKTAPCCG